ncbi:hypothetical protein KFE98_09970 [bacterium SCSIO 12741]|nr:hypothetical protein KFE98_09970 [bacterium SCSIO 12741]
MTASQAELDKWEKSFGFIPLVQTLKAKQFQLQQDLRFEQQLKKAALFSPDREKLYHFIHQPAMELVDVVEEEVASEPEVITTSLEVVEPEPVEEKLETPPETEPEITPEAIETIEEPVQDTEAEARERELLEKQLLSYAVSASIEREVSDELSAQEPVENVVQEEKEEVQPSAPVEEPGDPGLLSWLKRVEKKETQKVSSPDSLISTFIEKGPVEIPAPVKDEKPTMVPINRPKAEFFSLDKMARESLREDDDMVTETLAKIHAKQGHFDKAIEVYEKLSLKFPEKSGYFARLISELKEKR